MKRKSSMICTTDPKFCTKFLTIHHLLQKLQTMDDTVKRKRQDQVALGEPKKKKSTMDGAYSVCDDNPFETRECYLACEFDFGDDDSDVCIQGRLRWCHVCEQFVCKQHKIRLYCCDRVVCKQCHDNHKVAWRCVKCEKKFCDNWTKGCDRCDGSLCLPCFGKTKDESEENCEECWDTMCAAFK